MGFRRLAMVPFILALAMLFAPSAGADTYTEQVVGKFQAQTHVVADPAAKPPLENSDADQPADPGQLVDVEFPPPDLGGGGRARPDRCDDTGRHPRHHLGPPSASSAESSW